jgi:hypothetical protein
MILKGLNRIALASALALGLTGAIAAQDNYWQHFDRPYDSRGINQSARSIGHEDGLLDGENDRRSGRSFRPTHDGNYRHADRGYSSRYGDKEQYKLAYREAYERGYQEGYDRPGYR